ncbi:MAG: hypothetical protein AAF411_02435 [Myxococcota bacterium]
MKFVHTLMCLSFIAALMCLSFIAACSDDDSASDSTDVGTDASAAPDAPAADGSAPDSSTPEPIALTDDLCERPELLPQLLAGMDVDAARSFGDTNLEQVMRMLEAPLDGPFYNVNFIRFREQAVYPDGRETTLTGEEANALYAPVEFLEAIGARVVYTARVSSTSDGAASEWDEIAIVEYPCPLALFAMSEDPAFAARSIHKDAGLESSIVLVAYPEESDALEPAEAPFPSTASDPTFDRVQMIRLRDLAAYETDETGTGIEAMARYDAALRETQAELGVEEAIRFRVDGVFIGDARTWDQVRIERFPSAATLEALRADEAFAEASRHRMAAVDEDYDLLASVNLSAFEPGSGGPGFPVTEDGVGTPCASDDDCPGDGALTCLGEPGAMGFCTREGCGGGDCGAGYACCRECDEVVAAMLPFSPSACLPEAAVSQLSSPPASCT